MSFLPARPGPAFAPRSLSGPFGLAWRLQRTTLLGWTTGFLCAGAVFGGIAQGASDLVGGNQQTREIVERMGGQQGLTEAFLATMAGLLGMVASLYAAGAVLRLRGEETGERAEPVLAGAVGRLRWAGSHLVIAYGGTAVILASGGLALGLAHGLSVDDLGGQLGPVLAAALSQVPAVWTLTGLAVLVLGLLPKATPAVWALVGGCLAIGRLGPSLKFPPWAGRWISPRTAISPSSPTPTPPPPRSSGCWRSPPSSPSWAWWGCAGATSADPRRPVVPRPAAPEDVRRRSCSGLRRRTSVAVVSRCPAVHRMWIQHMA